MHVALLCGEHDLGERREALRALVVGLVSEGVLVSVAVPEGTADPDVPGGGLGGATYRFVTPAFAIGGRWMGAWLYGKVGSGRHWVRLAEQIERSGDVPGVIVSSDAETWLAAVAAGRLLDVPVLLFCHDRFDARLAPRLFTTLNPTRCLMAAGSEPIAQQLRDATQNLVVVEHVPPGVHLSDRTPRHRGPDEPLCVVISTDGPLDESYLACLEGLAMHCRERPSTLALLEGPHPDSHACYKQLRRLGLTGQCSFAPRGQDANSAKGVDGLLLEADAVIHPQALGRNRPITLEAMARGLPVAGADDPALDTLIDGHTAWVVDELLPYAQLAEAWYGVLTRLTEEPEEARELGRRAQQWVREEHLFSDELERVLGLCRRLAAEPVKFPG
ncbi:MAG: glycosyltransferase [Planctomycetota bacterium]